MFDVVEKYGGLSVPRYTSYPAATHFKREFPEPVYRSWLEALPANARLSLYLHVPFCKKMCWYCGCHMKLVQRYEPVADYVETLLAEIDLVARVLPTSMRVAHIHLGGGTPTVLQPRDLSRIMARLRRYFHIEEGAELALECDPRTLDPQLIETLREEGFTRASLGVQEFDETVQNAINRHQSPDMVRRAVDMLRSAGIKGINFDLLYGLPKQRQDMVEKTVEHCLDMQPDRIALFGYAHVPWFAKNQRMIDASALPDMRARVSQAGRAAQLLVEHGYTAIGMDHFARSDDPLAQAVRSKRLRRNFQGYTTDESDALLGFGVTSISSTPHGYAQNTLDSRGWARSIDEGRLPVSKGKALSGDDRLRREVIEKIMCLEPLDLDETGRAYHASPDWWADAYAPLTSMVKDGLIGLKDAVLEVHEAGRPYVRVIASLFDSYLQSPTARHSVAV